MKYIFKTTATMKEYNAKKWWIDGDIVPEIRISADCLDDAISVWAEQVKGKHCISISKSAIKNKSSMYVDTVCGNPKQVGYVITGKADFEKDDCTWVGQYIDLWVEIVSACETDF